MNYTDIISLFSPEFGVCSFEAVKDNLIQCRNISKIPENAQSIIVCLFPYFLGEDKYMDSDISKYAVVPDYHIVISDLLQKCCEELKKTYYEEEFVPFIDNSPIPEVTAAEKSGLGIRGKNRLLINDKYGSWVFIGEIVTTLKIQPNKKYSQECLNCNLCISNCPTGALSDNGINIKLCLSDITQRKGSLSSYETNKIMESGCLWGCDICQDVCPLNKKVKINPVNEFTKNIQFNADTENLSDRAYAWRGKKTIERNMEILKSKETKQ